MSAILESKTPHFGLKDFLQYLIPGAVTLISIGLFVNVDRETVKGFSGIGTSIFMVLFAYFLGQVVYGATYPLRHFFRSKRGLPENCDDFKNAHMCVIEEHTAYYTAMILRYRTFARFSVAVILPSIMLGIAICIRLWPQSEFWGVVVLCAGIVTSIMFIYRYRRYDFSFRDQVIRCKNFDWEKRADASGR